MLSLLLPSDERDRDKDRDRDHLKHDARDNQNDQNSGQHSGSRSIMIYFKNIISSLTRKHFFIFLSNIIL